VFARAAGLGWQGKNTMLLSTRRGSWFFLAELLTDLALTADEPSGSHCGRCTACLTGCPTQALGDGLVLDARRCISYLTIEHHGPIPRDLRASIGTWVFGCDICQEVCPWNKEPAATHPAFAPREEYRATPITDLLRYDQADFSALFHKSAVKRAKLAGMKRNVSALTEAESRGMLKP